MRITVILTVFVCGLGSCATRGISAVGNPGLKHFDADVRGLRHEIVFHPGSEKVASCFTATLRNESDRNLGVQVNARLFRAKLKIRTSQGREFEAFEKHHLKMLCCATWIDSVEELPAGACIRWVLPLDSLVTIDGAPVSSKSLVRATMVSELPVSGTILKSKQIHLD